MLRLVVILGLAALLVACGGSAPAASPAASAAPVSALDAAGVVARLQAAGLPIGRVVAYDATTDPNALLGRPNQYTSKAMFAVPSLGTPAADISVDDGGSVEVFATESDATARLKYVDAITSSASLFAEYHWQHGRVLLRLSHRVTPDEAARWQAALGTLDRT